MITATDYSLTITVYRLLIADDKIALRIAAETEVAWGRAVEAESLASMRAGDAGAIEATPKSQTHCSMQNNCASLRDDHF